VLGGAALAPRAAAALMRGIFVTGTGTQVGKSVVAAAMCAALAGRGERVAAFKPAVTGLDEPAGEWPPDHELLAGVASAGQSPADVAPRRYGPALSPHFAAELAGETIEPAQLVEAARTAGERSDALVCEGVGGLLVPITPGYLVRDLAVELALPVVVAAGTGLGTINHTLLTVEAARAAGLSVAAVVMTPWPAEPAPVQASNRATVELLGRVPVGGLPPTEPGSLAAAGRSLRLDDWL
jgi:dethiobiotin synthetase